MKIPYGTASFTKIRREGYFYVDKTPFLPLLESGERGYQSLLFLRPRRMGKSALLSMMEHYYDIRRAPEFDELFGGLWVHEHPTPERNAFLVLKLNFSSVGTDGDHAAVARSFCGAIKTSITTFAMRYRERIPEIGGLYDELKHYDDATSLIATLMAIVAGTQDKLYILIDEYDQFANALLSVGKDDLYQDITRATGFVRSFYRALKEGMESGGVARLFVTGVSPLLVDDLASGFNVVTNISLDPRLNTLAGFTRADVERGLDELLLSRPDLTKIPRIGDRSALLAVLEQYYNGYRFAEDAAEKVFNSDLILYFLRELASHGKYPDEMLDVNVRTDYGKLQRMALAVGAAGVHRRAILERVLDEGYVWGVLLRQFGAADPSPEDQFISLLYYVGMLTLSPTPRRGNERRFEVPNRVIRELAWEHFASLLKQEQGVILDTHPIRAALLAMTVEGAVEPFTRAFHEHVMKVMGVKDLRQFNEKTLKMMLMTCAVLSGMFSVLSEKEMAQGYCDLFLGPSRLVQDARYAWLLEIKYLQAKATPAQIAKAESEAEEQLRRYTGDAQLVPLLTQGKELRAGTLLFLSSKEIRFRPWPPETASRAKKAAEKAARAKKTPEKAARAKKTPEKAARAKKTPARSRKVAKARR